MVDGRSVGRSVVVLGCTTILLQGERACFGRHDCREQHRVSAAVAPVDGIVADWAVVGWLWVDVLSVYIYRR